MKKSETDTLPDPELNPLLNPLLAAHMGRWAEVYFTSPPEKRTQAVAELLRELQSAFPSEDTSVRTASGGEHLDEGIGEQENQIQKNQIEEKKTSQTSYLESDTTCSTCGNENAVGQMFCGMCGKALQPSLQILRELDLRLDAENTPLSEERRSQPEASFAGAQVPHEAQVPYEIEPANVSPVVDEDDFERDRARQLPEEVIPSFAAQPETVPYRYRIYVGAGLGILLALLLYMAWRGTTTFTGVAQSAPSRAIPAAPPASPPASSASEQIPASQRPALQSSSQSKKSAENVLSTNGSPGAPFPTPTKREPDSSKERAVKAHPAPATSRDQPRANPRSAIRVVPEASRPPVGAAVQSGAGAEELGMAQKYLNARDSGSAAPWLWKSVAKGNLAATMTLSDLYLRGEGVPKNCDQARLLLDAAARKGGKGAADRLRNLQAFGCQ